MVDIEIGVHLEIGRTNLVGIVDLRGDSIKSSSSFYPLSMARHIARAR
jgi:hypothetical protein